MFTVNIKYEKRSNISFIKIFRFDFGKVYITFGIKFYHLQFHRKL